MNPPSIVYDDAIHGTAERKKAFDRLNISYDGYLTIDDYQPNRSKVVLLPVIPWYREIIPAIVLESRKGWYKYVRFDTNWNDQVDYKKFVTPESGQHLKKRHQQDIFYDKMLNYCT